MFYIRVADESDASCVAQLYLTTYYKAGYIRPGYKSIKEPKTDKDLVKDTVFVACVRDEGGAETIVGTMSVTNYQDISDSPLACDFSSALQEIAQSYKNCSLIWRLAIAEQYRHSRSIVFLLMEAAIQMGLSLRYGSLVCVVHPKHVLFYSKCLAFQQKAKCENLTGLKNAPAVLLFGQLEIVRDMFKSLRNIKVSAGNRSAQIATSESGGV